MHIGRSEPKSALYTKISPTLSKKRSSPVKRQKKLKTKSTSTIGKTNDCGR